MHPWEVWKVRGRVDATVGRWERSTAKSRVFVTMRVCPMALQSEKLRAVWTVSMMGELKVSKRIAGMVDGMDSSKGGEKAARMLCV